jgi:hypothetical protein
MMLSATPLPVMEGAAAGRLFSSVTCGSYFSFAISGACVELLLVRTQSTDTVVTVEGDIVCFGDNSVGQLGLGLQLPRHPGTSCVLVAVGTPALLERSAFGGRRILEIVAGGCQSVAVAGISVSF